MACAAAATLPAAAAWRLGPAGGPPCGHGAFTADAAVARPPAAARRPGSPAGRGFHDALRAIGGLSLACGAVGARQRRRGRPRAPRAAARPAPRQRVARRAHEGESAADRAAPVPVVLLSGFLGTGKTTLLKHWLEHSEGRIGVVVNDVAAVNIDAKLVDQQKANAKGTVDTIHLQNGCACCSMGDELITTIFDLLDLADGGQPFSQIIVELSGVAEPKRVREMFERAESSGYMYMEGIELSRVVTLIDASTFCKDYMEYSRLYQRPDLVEEEAGDMLDIQVVALLVEQLEAADVVVLNKTDLADGESLSATRTMVGALNERAAVRETSFGRVPLSAVLAGPGDANGHKAPQARGHEEHGHEAHGHEAHSHEAEAHGHGAEGHGAEGHRCGHSHEAHGQGAEGHSCGHSHGCEDPECADPSHGHSHGHSHECSDPDCTDPSHGHTHTHSHSSKTTAEERFGITSFTYSARRPFHADRLAEVLQKWPEPQKDCLGQMLRQPSGAEEPLSPFSGVLRSKGFCWLDTYPSSRMYWSHAGKALCLEYDNAWWGALPEEQLQLMESMEQGAYARAKKEDWTEEWADRRQELVFIGQRMDELSIRAALDGCLLRDGEEMSAYLEKQEKDAAAIRAEWVNMYNYEY